MKIKRQWERARIKNCCIPRKGRKNNDTALKKMSNGKISGEDTPSFNPMFLKGENYCSPKGNKTPPIAQHHTGTSPTYKKIIRDIK